MSESLNIIKYNENKNEIVLATEIIYNPPVILSIDGNLFMQEIGANCLTDSKYTYNTDQLITIAKIRSTQNNIYTISISTNAFVDKYGCVFLDDETRDYFYLYRRKDGAIRAINKNKFLEAYTPYLCKSLDSIEQYFKKFIYSKNARWIYKEQQDKNGILDYIQKLYKEYKKLVVYNCMDSI